MRPIERSKVPPDSIREQGGLVLIDTRGSGLRELSGVYQAFGLLCTQRKVRWALLKTGAEDPEAHYALRDILGTVAGTAGIPVRFQLALLATFVSTAHVFGAMEGGLRGLGCDARVFRMERRANAWLCGASERRARARAQGVALVCPGRPRLPDGSRNPLPCSLGYSCVMDRATPAS